MGFESGRKWHFHSSREFYLHHYLGTFDTQCLSLMNCRWWHVIVLYLLQFSHVNQINLVETSHRDTYEGIFIFHWLEPFQIVPEYGVIRKLLVILTNSMLLVLNIVCLVRFVGIEVKPRFLVLRYNWLHRISASTIHPQNWLSYPSHPDHIWGNLPHFKMSL